MAGGEGGDKLSQFSGQPRLRPEPGQSLSRANVQARSPYVLMKWLGFVGFVRVCPAPQIMLDTAARGYVVPWLSRCWLAGRNGHGIGLGMAPPCRWSCMPRALPAPPARTRSSHARPAASAAHLQSHDGSGKMRSILKIILDGVGSI